MLDSQNVTAVTDPDQQGPALGVHESRNGLGDHCLQCLRWCIAVRLSRMPKRGLEFDVTRLTRSNRLLELEFVRRGRGGNRVQRLEHLGCALRPICRVLAEQSTDEDVER